MQAKYAYLEAEGIQPFAQEAVPKAALRLRQALGRLIRSEEDREGIADSGSSFSHCKIWQTINQSVSQGTLSKEAPMPEILEELKEFLNK